jgi:hypothetical protein
MGHIRMGRLPKTRRWLEVIGWLEERPFDLDEVAGGTADAAGDRLTEMGKDRFLGYTVWLLTRIAAAALGMVGG